MSEFDHNATIEALFERMQALLQADEEYFALLNVISENSKYSSAISKHIFRLKKRDQLKLMRCAAENALVAKELCLKYELPLDDDSDDTGDEI